jgi:hypothetical protein
VDPLSHRPNHSTALILIESSDNELRGDASATSEVGDRHLDSFFFKNCAQHVLHLDSWMIGLLLRVHELFASFVVNRLYSSVILYSRYQGM